MNHSITITDTETTGTDPGSPLTRRKLLQGLAVGTALTMVPLRTARGAGEERDTAVFRDTLETLKVWLAKCFAQSRVDYGNGQQFHTPCTSGTYRGIWPDDFVLPLVVQPSLTDVPTLNRALAFISDSILDLPRVPDRIEADGLPVLQPGGLKAPHGQHMPLHLPAAWVRLLDYFEQRGASIPRRAEWARLLERSFAQVPFANGLAYVDPQHPCVGFGFHDPCAITGLELMSSLVLHRGLQRAAKLFAQDAEPAAIQRWNRQATAIRDNLHRLWDEKAGAYLAGSRDCRQVNVWANGLAYWLSDASKQQRIVAWFRTERDKIFHRGCTRQIAEPDGWQRQLVPTALGKYTNGGFWSTGTGFVLPAIAHQDAEFARQLAEDIRTHLEQSGFAEWISAEGSGAGAKGFLMSITLPALGLTSILERKPLLEYF